MKEIISTIFTWCLLVVFLLLVIGLINPTLFTKYFRTWATRKGLSAIFGGAFVLFFILVGVTAPKPLDNLYDLNKAKEVQVSKQTDLDQLEAAIVVQNGLANLVTSFVEARLDMEIIVSADTAKLASADRNSVYDSTLNSLKKAEDAQQSFQKQLDFLSSEKLISFDFQYSNLNPLETSFQPKDQPFSFIQTAKAADEVGLKGGSTAYKFEDVIMATYDAAPNRQKLQAVADAIGKDIKTAHEVMRLINEANHAQALNDLEVATRYRDAAQVLATGSKVLVTIGGIAAAGPTLAVVGAANPLAGAVEIGAVSVSGADTVLEVAETGVQIAMKDSKEKDAMATIIHDAREWKPLKYGDTLVSIYDLTKAPKAMAKLLERKAAVFGTKQAKWASKRTAQYDEAFRELMTTLSGNMVAIQELFVEGDDQIVVIRNGEQTYVAPMENLEYVKKAYANGIKLSPADLKRMFQRTDQDPDFDLSMQQLGFDYLNKFEKEYIAPKTTTPTITKKAPIVTKKAPAPVVTTKPTPTPTPTPAPVTPAPSPTNLIPTPPVDACAGKTGCNACWCKGLACVCGYDSCACE